jgi:CRISPR-associated protein Cmr3
LYLSTPAIFKTGWKPDLEKKFGIKADLVAAVVGKPLHIGGFDMVKREPKTMYKAVPAGSVYYYKVTEGYELVEEKLQGKAISDVLKTQGFGIAYVGNY